MPQSFNYATINSGSHGSKDHVAKEYYISSGLNKGLKALGYPLKSIKPGKEWTFKGKVYKLRLFEKK